MRMGWEIQLPNDSWRAFVSAGSRAAKVQANATRETRRAARTAANEKLAAKIKAAGRPDHRGETFAELWADYKALHLSELSPTTRTGYESIYRKHLAPRFGRMVAADIDPTEVLRYKAAKRKGLSAMTVSHHLSLLSGVLAFGVRTRRLEWNAAEAVKGKKPRPGTPRRALEQNEALAVLAKALEMRGRKPSRKGVEVRDLYGVALIGICAGLRRGEVLALRWTDIDLKASALYSRWNLVREKGKGVVLKDTKAEGEEVRPVLLPRVATDELRAIRKRQAARALQERGWNPGGIVFAGDDGSWRRPDTFTHDFAKLLTEAKIERADFHTLRHTHATWLRDDGIDPLTIRDRQGHSDVKTTEGYMHAKLAVQKPAAASLQKRLSSGAKY